MAEAQKEKEIDYGKEYQPKAKVWVIKKDGSREIFNVQKVINAVGKSAYRALTGFTVSDVQAGLLGTVEHVDDSSANILLTIRSQSGDDEWLIPFHDDFLVHFDLRQRTLLLQLPEGILALNGME